MNEWIKTSDKLPRDKRIVLFVVNWGETPRIAKGWHVASVPQWIAEEGILFHSMSYSWITHWMPLPEPPEEVKGE